MRYHQYFATPQLIPERLVASLPSLFLQATSFSSGDTDRNALEGHIEIGTQVSTGCRPVFRIIVKAVVDVYGAQAECVSAQRSQGLQKNR
jgi:hypothetical protein